MGAIIEGGQHHEVVSPRDGIRLHHIGDPRLLLDKRPAWRPFGHEHHTIATEFERPTPGVPEVPGVGRITTEGPAVLSIIDDLKTS
jgi:hypothetical protein